MCYGSVEARHARRLQLMRMQGETNRMEARNHMLIAVAVVLGLLAFALSMWGTS
jgi:hypothetical protein